MINDYPPYPEDWIILEEDDTDRWDEPYPPSDEPERIVYREVQAAKLTEFGLSIFYATMWLLEDLRNTWEESISPDMGATLQLSDVQHLYHLLRDEYGVI